jgi:hypothetical protein
MDPKEEGGKLHPFCIARLLYDLTLCAVVPAERQRRCSKRFTIHRQTAQATLLKDCCSLTRWYIHQCPSKPKRCTYMRLMLVVLSLPKESWRQHPTDPFSTLRQAVRVEPFFILLHLATLVHNLTISHTHRDGAEGTPGSSETSIPDDVRT